ncbi:MAG: PEGA domain-containing protein [Pirellulaceae bacterium]|nr:PEGA domain-containing protein [Pirellulaceae bacterium]
MKKVYICAIATFCVVIVPHFCEAAVRRRLTIRSNPPGALVFIDDQEIGVTPVSTSFIYYGTRKIQLIKDGYETVTVLRTFKPPWYQWAGIDFITENLVRSEFRDERLIEFKLTPLRIKTNKELVERGIQLRQRVRQGIVTTVPMQPRNLRTLYPQPRATTPVNRDPRRR